jgi:hypothetical protein
MSSVTAQSANLEVVWSTPPPQAKHTGTVSSGPRNPTLSSVSKPRPQADTYAVDIPPPPPHTPKQTSTHRVLQSSRPPQAGSRCWSTHARSRCVQHTKQDPA